jgi:SAM-dependent methyltransferase
MTTATAKGTRPRAAAPAADPLHARLRALIADGLAAPYTSHSGTDGTATGNHYQSVALGDEATAGFRGDRAAVLDCVDFRGRKVLDLGSNLGEMSRSARARGARLVDGIEFDPFFVELAQLITAYNGQSRVSFRQGDVTDPALYGERYDVVLALSVFHYVSRVLDRLAAITDVLIVETHKLHGNFDSGYLVPLRQRFPAMRVLGQTDWGQLGDGSETRLVIAFAKRPRQLDELLVAPHAWQQPPSAPVELPRRRACTIDPAASSLHRAFFEAWDYPDAERLLAAVDKTPVSVEALAENRNLARHGYSGWAYWFLYLKGWLHYRASGVVGAGNPYFDYMTNHFPASGADAALGRAVRDPTVAERTLRRRFADLDRFHAAGGKDVAADTTPIRAIVGTQPRNPLRLAEAGGRELVARRVDGWHRLFGARALGIPRLRAEVVEEPRVLPLLRGVAETLALADGRVRANGWCLDLGGPLDAVELRLDGETLALATPHERADVADAYPNVAHARASGFALEGELRGWRDEPARFEVVGVRDWLPVGRLRIDYEPGMLDVPASPGDSVRVALRTALACNALIDAVAHYRAPEQFQDVAMWDAGNALLTQMAERRLPGASRVSLDAAADGSVDLVLRDRPLAALGEDALDAWLARLARILRPGGYAAFVAGWAADARGDALARCGERLDVVGAAIGGAWAGGDVVVLRKP